MENRKISLFFEKFLIWKGKGGPESQSSSVDPLDKARTEYFKLREYLRANYKKLDEKISDKIIANPSDKSLREAKGTLAEIAFDDRFDPNTISKEDMQLVAKAVSSGVLEHFYGNEVEKGGVRLCDLANDIAEELNLDELRIKYFKLRECLRSNYKKLDDELSDRLADDPDDEIFQEAKKILAQIAFDDRFDANTISKEDMKLAVNAVVAGVLECFFGVEIEGEQFLGRLAGEIQNKLFEYFK